jgi:6-phosphogluconolactonase
LNTWRISFTYPLINASRHICFLVEGADKKPLVEQILAGEGDYPSEGVKPTDGKLTWLLG